MRLIRLTLIAALVLTALVALWTLIFSRMDETSGKILATTASVAGYSLLMMGAAAGGGRERPQAVQVAAIVASCASLAAFALLMAVVWVDRAWLATGVVKGWFHCTIAAIAIVIVVLLARLRLPARQAWLLTISQVMVLVFAGLADVLWVILGHDSDGWNRTAAVVGVLAALGILTMPLLAWRARREAAAVPARPHATCPQCGHKFEVG